MFNGKSMFFSVLNFAKKFISTPKISSTSLDAKKMSEILLEIFL